LAVGCERGNARPEPVETVAQEDPGVVRRAWRANNEQARLMAGDLTISLEGREGDEDRPVVFAFANGVTVRAAPSAARIAGLQSILGAPPEVAPKIYRVAQERVSPSARLGGLCAGLRTSYVAFAEYVDADGDWTLRLASFHQAASQDRDAAETPVLCFALDYALTPQAE
jgi:hypothetical protein